ncbi:thioredoxin O2, mitochondrial-like isoform X2 [Tasmannia lanceolata]
MGRNSPLRSLFRPLFSIKPSPLSSQTTPSLSSVKTLKPQTLLPFCSPCFSSSTSRHSSEDFFLFLNRRTFCSSTSPSSIVVVKSDEEFNSSLNKVQDNGLPAIFYFTAVWCGPCKFISPFIEESSKKYNVTTYKIDVDQEDLGSTLSKLQISSVPTLHFFQNGKKASEMIGADLARLKDTMENLYK